MYWILYRGLNEWIHNIHSWLSFLTTEINVVTKTLPPPFGDRYVYITMIPIMKPDIYRTWFSLMLLMFSTVKLSENLQLTFQESSAFGKHGGENTSHAEIRRDVELSVEQNKWCRAMAPLVAHTETVLLYNTVYINSRSRVIPHLYRMFFSTLIVFNFFRKNLTCI